MSIIFKNKLGLVICPIECIECNVTSLRNFHFSNNFEENYDSCSLTRKFILINICDYYSKLQAYFILFPFHFPYFREMSFLKK